MKIAYLGPRGTFTEEAALMYIENSVVDLIPCQHISEVITLLEQKKVDEGIVPIENSYGGQVNVTLDALAVNRKIKIRKALSLSVEQYLLAREEVKEKDISRILSHSQAFAQCHDFIKENLPGVELAETTSTAEGAFKVAGSNQPWGAIGSKKLAETYNLKIITKVNDSPQNTTRFLVLGLTEAPYGARAKTSIVLYLKDDPGSLFDILREFAYANINLTKIESRPSKKKLGEQLFFIDFLGHHLQPHIKRVLDSISDKANELINSGSYPYENGDVPMEAMTYFNSIPEIRKDIDIIDRQVIELLSKRIELVGKLSTLKGSPGKVKDAEREKIVIERIREIANSKNVDADFTEDLYQIIIEHCVQLQVTSLNNT